MNEITKHQLVKVDNPSINRNLNLYQAPLSYQYCSRNQKFEQSGSDSTVYTYIFFKTTSLVLDSKKQCKEREDQGKYLVYYCVAPPRN